MDDTKQTADPEAGSGMVDTGQPTHEPNPIPDAPQPKTAGEAIADWNPDDDPVQQEQVADGPKMADSADAGFASAPAGAQTDTGTKNLADDGTAVGDPPADTNEAAEEQARSEQGLDPIHATHPVDVELDHDEVDALSDAEPIAAAGADAPLTPPPLSTDAISVKNDPEKPDAFARVAKVLANFKGTDSLGNISLRTRLEDDLGISPHHWGKLGDAVGEEFGIHIKRTDAGNFGKVGDIVHTVLRTERLSG